MVKRYSTDFIFGGKRAILFIDETPGMKRFLPSHGKQMAAFITDDYLFTFSRGFGSARLRYSGRGCVDPGSTSPELTRGYLDRRVGLAVLGGRLQT